MTVFIEDTKTKFISTDSLEDFQLVENLCIIAGLDVDPYSHDIATDEGWLLSASEFDKIENGLQCLDLKIKLIPPTPSMSEEFKNWIEEHLGVEIVTRESYYSWKELKEGGSKIK